MQRATGALSSSELILGRYRPIRPLGGGSSGSVWLARDERSGLDVALKIVPREGKTGARAEREAGAAAKLRHPRCQRIYAQASDGSHVYIAYEYVAGSTMREATRNGKLTDAGAVEAAAQILEGLAHAHGKGIVHRDVKPANVLLEDGPETSIRLLDFGLARFAEADTLTAVGDVPGTLAYISPERLRGEAASPASDVWSVGVMLWEALAGRHPFWAPSLLATSKKIEAGAPPLQRARPDLPKPLVAAVARALHPDPMQRPGAAELAKTLRLARRKRTSTSTAPAPRPGRASAARPRGARRPRRALRRLGGSRASLLSDRRAGRAGAARRSAHLFQPAGRPRPRAARAGLPAREHGPRARAPLRPGGRDLVRAPCARASGGVRVRPRPAARSSLSARLASPRPPTRQVDLAPSAPRRNCGIDCRPGRRADRRGPLPSPPAGSARWAWPRSGAP